jgi:DNA mismatch repair ATPase MutS
MYSFEFNGFIEIIHGLSNQIQTQQLNPCTMLNVKKKSKKRSMMMSLFYAGLINQPSEDIVKNTVKFDKHFILTGPNASGKTTLLKAILINSIFSQQFGYGCYSKFIFKPYHHFHCYLNICDNSSRDSLFQSESKKCQSIINAINKGSDDERHFCAFDELFSGTNPKEAVNCGYGFLSYLCKKKKCATFLLTTHYLELCKKLKNEVNTAIYRMVVDKQEDGIKYKYLIEKGFNTVDGGIDVLKQLNFPDEIVNLIEIQ